MKRNKFRKYIHMHLITEQPAKLVVPVTERRNMNKIPRKRNTHQAPATPTHH